MSNEIEAGDVVAHMWEDGGVFMGKVICFNASDHAEVAFITKKGRVTRFIPDDELFLICKRSAREHNG